MHELMDNETLSQSNAGDDMRHVKALKILGSKLQMHAVHYHKLVLVAQLPCKTSRKGATTSPVHYLSFNSPSMLHFVISAAWICAC